MNGVMRGTFIVIEGFDGVGKSTLSNRLAGRLRSEGHDVLEVREPGGTPVAEARSMGLLLGPFPESDLWQLIAEYDVINHAYPQREVGHGQVVIDSVALGANTGLAEIAYRPRILADPALAGLAEAMQAVVLADTLGR